MFGALGFYSAKGMIVVPAVLGQTQSTAQTNITNANLVFTTSSLNTNVQAQDGTVGTQSISPGTLVDYGTNVVLGIYSYVALPQISNPELSQARTGSSTANVSVTNYDSSVSYTISFAASGTATFSAGVFSISGISSDASFSATVYANKSGFSGGQGSVTVEAWSPSVSFGGNLTVSSTTTSSITLSASMWNTSSFSTTWYCQRNGTTIASGGLPPFTQQSSPISTSFTASGLAEGTSYSFNLYVNGSLVSGTTGTTGTTPPPVSQTWYCRQWNASGGIIATYTSSANQTGSTDCESTPTICSLSGYPTQAVYC
jgi:hypothetical protein